jgi:hypothetical protein
VSKPAMSFGRAMELLQGCVREVVDHHKVEWRGNASGNLFPSQVEGKPPLVAWGVLDKNLNPTIQFVERTDTALTNFEGRSASSLWIKGKYDYPMGSASLLRRPSDPPVVSHAEARRHESFRRTR